MRHVWGIAMRKTWIGALACAIALVASLAVTGCGPKYTQIGEAGDDTSAVLVDNALGEAITAFSVMV